MMMTRRLQQQRAARTPLSVSLLLLVVVALVSCACRPALVQVLASDPPTPDSPCLTDSVPVPLADECALGYYCPNYNASDASTYPSMCSITVECLKDRVLGDFCPAQGLYEPTLCAEGFYCPTPMQQLQCPEGYFCPIGQYEPIECGPLVICPAGSHKKQDLSSVLAVVILDAFMLALYYASHVWLKQHRKTRDESNEVKASRDPSLLAKGAAFDSLSDSSKMVCRGFKRAQQQLPPMLIEFDQLSLAIPVKGKEKVILKGVTGSIEPGKVTAIMGPSGAGKTTFLNVMLGAVDRSWTRGGSLRINGVSEDLDRFRKIIGYVPQEDIMHRDLSVYDNIRYSADVRLPRNWTDVQRQDHVNAVIRAMQLTHVQDTCVGDEVKRGVSGGQRKRCNIGMEVAAAPSLLLLDEPTSGLDSTAALVICELLNDLAHVSSLTVAMVIHQPRQEIWNKLDELLLLAPGGLTVYQGPQRLCVRYFEARCGVVIPLNENPADSLMDEIALRAAEFVRSWEEGGLEFMEHMKGAEVQETVVKRDASRIDEEIEESQRQSDDEALDDEQVAAVAANAIANVAQGSGGASDSSSSPLPLAGAMAANAPSHLIYVTPRASTTPPSARLSPRPAAAAAVTTVAFGGIAVDARPAAATGAAAGPASSYGTLHSARSHVVPAAFRPSSRSAPLRQTASFLRQLWLSLERSLWKQRANTSSFALELGLCCFAGFYMGATLTIGYQGFLKQPFMVLSPAPYETAIPDMFFNIGLAMSLAAVSAGVAVFAEEQVIYRREVAAGHHHLAYYIGVSLAQIPRCFINGVHFAFLFHILLQPVTTFADFVPIAFLLFLTVYGLAAFVSMLVVRKNAALLGVVCSLIFSTMTAKSNIPEGVQYFSASRWASEALFNQESLPFRHFMQVEEFSAPTLGYEVDRFAVDMILVCTIAIFYRLCAYIAMRWVDRKIIS